MIFVQARQSAHSKQREEPYQVLTSDSLHLDPGHHLLHFGPDGFEPEKTRTLKTDLGWGVIAADFNHDGYLEIVTSCNHWEDLRIYYGRDNYERYDDIPLNGKGSPRWICAADINKNGWLDLVVPLITSDRSLILRGGPEGFSLERSQELAVLYGVSATAADLTHNGYPDIIIGGHTETPKNGEMIPHHPHHSFVYIYWNGPEGLSESRKCVLRGDASCSLSVLDDSTEANVHALDDVLQFIAGNSRMHMKTSMKTIKDRFMKAPYGFVEDDVQWLVARLFRRGDLAFTVNGESVNANNRSEEELIGFITKKQYVDKLLMEVRVRVPDKQKKAVRTVMKELFNVTPTADDEDTMMTEFRRYCERTITSIDRLEPKYQNYAYPGKPVLATGKKLMNALLQIGSPLEFFKEVSDEQDDLLDFGDDFEPVHSSVISFGNSTPSIGL